MINKQWYLILFTQKVSLGKRVQLRASGPKEGKVAALVGGKVARQQVIVEGLGRTDIDVIGKAGEYIAVGGPAKAASDVGRQLQILNGAGWS